MKKNDFLFLTVVLFFSFLTVTSCFSFKNIDSNNPVQIGRFTFTITAYNKEIVRPIILNKIGNNPLPIMADLMEKNYYLFVQAASKEGIRLDVERFKNEFLNPEFPKKFKITFATMYEFTVDPQDSIYASCDIILDIDLNPRSLTYNELIVSSATMNFIQGVSQSKLITVK